MSSVEELNIASLAENTLTDGLVADFASAMANSSFSDFSYDWTPIYYKGDSESRAGVVVEALGYKPTHLLSDTSTLWSVRFTHEDGQRSNVIMYGGKLFSIGEGGEFVSERQAASSLLKAWERIVESGGKPVISMHGGGIGEQRTRTDRIPLLRRLIGQIAVKRWRDYWATI